MRKRGIRIVILTNSLASNDVPSVFGGCRKYREDILKLGIELYELRPKQGVQKIEDKSLGSSGLMGLHGKIIIADQKDMYVGSMNMDLRSKNLNTELVVILKNSKLASVTAKKLLNVLSHAAYRVELHDQRIRWIEDTNGKLKYLDDEPETTNWQRTKAWLSSLLIPEEML